MDQYTLTLLFALICAAIVLTTLLASRTRRSFGQCRCGADAAIVIDHEPMCARHAWEKIEGPAPKASKQ